MPYSSNSSLPQSIRSALPEAAQTRWREVFNDRVGSGESEQSAIRQAWYVVGQGWEKGEGGEWVRKADDDASDITKVEAKVCKVDDGLGLVFGWAIVSEINGEPYYDTQGDWIPSDVALKSIAKFMRGERAAKAMHIGERVGTVDMAFPMTADIMKALGIESPQTGVIVAMRPDSADMLKRYSDGDWHGFSIGGMAVSEEVA